MKRITDSLTNKIGKKVAFDEIHQVFSESKYGEELSKRVRFKEYKPSAVDEKKWVEILGPDVDNLEHLYYTYILTRKFLTHFSPDSFSENEKEILLFTALIHDWGEVVVGDIRFPQKNSYHNKLEMIHIKKISNELLSEYELSDRVNSVLSEVLDKKNEKLSKSFDAIEKNGYVSTGIRAWKVSGFEDDELSVNLRSLAVEVVTNHYEPLVNYSEYFPMIRRYLNSMDDVISEIKYYS